MAPGLCWVFFSSRRRHTRLVSDWSSDVCSSDLTSPSRTARVLIEPNSGSDLASIRTRAVREGDVYKVYGNKTWITHPVRADLMTLLRSEERRVGKEGRVRRSAEQSRRRVVNQLT